MAFDKKNPIFLETLNHKNGYALKWDKGMKCTESQSGMW